MSTAPRDAAAAVLLLAMLAAPPLRSLLDSRMSLHMAVAWPLWLAAGWQLGRATAGAWGWLARVDAGGLLSATVASCVAAGWMVPAALDLTLLQPGVARLEHASWLLAGALLQAARARLTPVVAAFFLANAAWMTATAGLLYLDAEQALCVNYGVDDQQVAGRALIGWALVLGARALVLLRPLVAAPHPGVTTTGLAARSAAPCPTASTLLPSGSSTKAAKWRGVRGARQHPAPGDDLPGRPGDGGQAAARLVSPPSRRA